MPQFYLRRFSRDGASVGAFISPNHFIGHASIKGQSQRRYMYGRNPELEKMLSELEGQWSELLRNIDQVGSPPPIMSVGHRDLLFFIALQRGRTMSAAGDHEEALALMEDFKQRAYGEIGQTPPVKPELSHDQHVLRSLQIHLSAWPYLLDLQPLVLVNESTEMFITSDAPVSFHNDALFDLKHGGATAYSSPGLIVFLPISPIRAVLLFDRNMYNMGSHTGSAVIRPTVADVSTLNALTASNTSRVLYYAPGQPHAEILAASALAKRVRAIGRSITFEITVKEQREQRRIFAISPTCSQLSMKLSFLHILPKRAARMREILVQRPFPRHPELNCWLEAYQKASRDNSDSKLIKALQGSHPDLYSRLFACQRAFLGPVVSKRIPGIGKNILRAFAS